MLFVFSGLTACDRVKPGQLGVLVQNYGKNPSEDYITKSEAITEQQIQMELISKWNGQLPTYMMGNGQGVILNLPSHKQ